ncbi:MAG: glycosyltransferase [Bacteroidota bacterium]
MAGKRQSRRLDLSIIIVNYNVREFLHHALVSLQKALKGLQAEIFVVDNASDDGSVEMIRRRFPKIHLIANKENLGFAKANNLALRQARGEYILLINPDTVVEENTLRAVVGFLRDNADVGLAGCKILSPDGSFQSACRRSFPTPWVAFTKITGLSRLFPGSSLFGRYNLTYKNVDESYEVDAVSGSFMMVRRKVYETVGGLDEDFFMYGEDLDWCYRIQRAGWRIYYVHSTQIIHYKGESTKRSNIDEIKTFYEAMDLFVEKHFRYPTLFNALIKVGIAVASFGAFSASLVRPIQLAVVDFIVVNLSLLLAEYIWRGDVFLYPAYAYPIVYVVPAILIISTLYAVGVYTYRKMSVSRTMVGVLFGYIVISALTAFFREYAFSRAIVAISGALCLMLLPGWRLTMRVLGRTASAGRGTLFGKRTLIVGTDKNARELLRRLRTRIADGYEIIGFVETTRAHVGTMVDGVPILGSVASVGKVIKEHHVSDVIFSPHTLSYSHILSVIRNTREYQIGFHLVPSTMDVIIGKASVDTLQDLPLVQISYNLERSLNRIAKRVFDVVISGLLLCTVYPILYIHHVVVHRPLSGPVFQLPRVFSGELSLVGPPESSYNLPTKDTHSGQALFLGKRGLTGLVQLQGGRTVTRDEIEQYNLYYARNQSFMLDFEILLKTWMQ